MTQPATAQPTTARRIADECRFYAEMILAGEMDGIPEHRREAMRRSLGRALTRATRTWVLGKGGRWPTRRPRVRTAGRKRPRQPRQQQEPGRLLYWPQR